MEMPEINSRVKNLIEKYSQGNENAFSKEIGVSQPRINRLFSPDPRSGKYPLVSLDIIQSIINKFVEVDLYWLIQGKMPNNTLLNEPSTTYSTSKITQLENRLKDKEEIVSSLKEQIVSLKDHINTLKGNQKIPSASMAKSDRM